MREWLARVVGGVNIAASEKLAAAQRPALDSVLRFLTGMYAACRLKCSPQEGILPSNRRVRQQISRPTE